MNQTNPSDACSNVEALTPEESKNQFYTICSEDLAAIRTDDNPPVFARKVMYSEESADAIRKEASKWVLLYRWSYGSDYGYDQSSGSDGEKLIPVSESVAAEMLVDEGRFVGILMRSKGQSFNKRMESYDTLHAVFVSSYQGEPILCAHGGESFSSDDHERWDLYSYYLQPPASGSSKA